MSITTDLEVFSRTGFSVSVTPAAESLKDQALESSALVARVTNDEENESAANALKRLKACTREVEKARKAIKEPFLDACRRIDAQAKEFSAELEEEERRVATLAADYATEQTRRMREIEAKRAEEAARIERERLEAERKIREEQEAQARAAKAKADAEAKAARNERERIAAAERAKAEQERIAKEAEAMQKANSERAMQSLEASTPAPVTTKPEGVSARAVWDFEVTDVWTLARLHPGLVTVTPNRREILDVIASGVREIKGLRIFEKTQLTVRTAHSKAIEV